MFTMFRRNFLTSLIGLFLSQGLGSRSVKYIDQEAEGYKNIRQLWMYKSAFDQGIVSR